jgi:hypothetical protein
MIFYGWIIGYTLCNLQRITILERWSQGVKDDFSAWLVSRDDNKNIPMPLRLFEKIEFAHLLDLQHNEKRYLYAQEFFNQLPANI